MANEAAPLRYIRAAFTGTLLRILPAQIETLEEVRELANEGLGGNVPYGCMDLLGQHGKLVRDTDLADCGPFVDVVLVRRKIVCGGCSCRMSCHCGAAEDVDCVCTSKLDGYCTLCAEEYDSFHFFGGHYNNSDIGDI